jgi:ABC-type multidrug transport system fused ATPase/permease subunit
MRDIKWLLKTLPKTLIMKIFLTFLLFFLAELGMLVLPLIYANILDKVEYSKIFPMTRFALWGGLILLLVFIKNFSIFRNSLQKFVIHKTLVENTASQVIKIPFSEVSKNGSQYYVDAILNRTSNVSSLLDIESMTGIVNLFRLVILTILFFLMDWIIGLASVAVIISSIFIYRYGNEYYLKNNRNFVEKKRKYLSEVEDILTGKEEVENFRAFEYEEKRNRKITEALRKILAKFLARDFIHFFIELDYIRISFELFVLAFAFFRAYEGYHSIGITIVLISYSRMFTTPIAYLNSILSNLRDSLTSLEIISNLSKTKEEVDVKMRDEGIEKIEFRGVAYESGGREILKDLTFEIYKGEKLAIIGPSGKGKSTVISLLLRDREYEKGDILINGVNLERVSREWLYSKIGALSQNSYLFPISVKENIRMGNAFLSEERIKSVLKMVRLWPIEMDRMIEDNGKNLSGGERTRLLLARLLVTDKDFLILDEPLEGVDTPTKREIIEGLKVMLKPKTAIVISHDIELLNALATKKVFI